MGGGDDVRLSLHFLNKAFETADPPQFENSNKQQILSFLLNLYQSSRH